MSTAIATAWKYRQVILLAIKVLKFLADRISESTPQEREDIRRHMHAVYQILRGAAKRKGEEIDLQPLSVFALPTASEGAEDNTVCNRRTRRVREATDQVVQSMRKYRLTLTRTELAEIADHLKHIGRLASEINSRAEFETTREERLINSNTGVKR